jgi:hypothetical protein
MRQHTQVGIGVAICVLIPLWWGVGTAAEPSDICRDLAGQFAKAPAELDARYLAALMLCVSTEVGERLQVAQVMPPASVQAETAPAPAPAPEESAAPPPRRMYGDWPQPSPWVGDWPTSTWDR